MPATRGRPVEGHGVERSELAVVDEQRHARVAEAERREARELLRELQAEIGAADDRVDRDPRPQVLVAENRVGVLGKRLGYGAAFEYKSAADIFREHAALSAFENNGSRDFSTGGGKWDLRTFAATSICAPRTILYRTSWSHCGEGGSVSRSIWSAGIGN